MTTRNWFTVALAANLLAPALVPPLVSACCPAPPPHKAVVNADQTVIIIWDAASKTQHFIRQASFKSEADDFGFLVPTLTQPELDESGNEAFPLLLKLTAPETRKVRRPSGGIGCGCSKNESAPPPAASPKVNVLAVKMVAGFHAVVLEAKSADSLVGWLKEHGYAYSPEIEAWAKPYVEAGWKITALKVAKDADGKADKIVAASSLRMSFKTDRPLFPYREPKSKTQAAAVGAKQRLLRSYLLAEARYQGTFTQDVAWTGQVAWANKLDSEHRKKVLEMLKLPETTGPAEWWLTEFEDNWPYQAAPGDVYFSRDAVQNPVKRPPIIEYVALPFPTDVTAYAIAAVLVMPPLFYRLCRTRRR
jgi:hypothetical protein